MNTRTAKTAKKCPLCDRPVGELSCREVKLGWYCLQSGLQLDDSRLIHVTVETGREEQKVIDEFTPLVAEESKLTDARLEQFSSAQSAHLQALTECARVGVSTSTVMSGVSVDYVRARRLSERDRQQLTAAEEETRENLEAAEQQLTRDRQRLAKLEARFDAKRRAARDRDRA